MYMFRLHQLHQLQVLFVIIFMTGF